MEIKEHEPLAAHSTFRMGKTAAYFAELQSAEDVSRFAEFAKEKEMPLFILGGGSNTVFADDHEIRACVGKIAIKGFEIISEDDARAAVKIGAGEEWDAAVARAVALNLAGIEALSAIPGTAGATPVQNVGAYGQEIANVLVSLEAFDLMEKKPVEIPASSCGFSYRDSKFKREWKGNYAITSITLSLSKTPPQVPAYPGIEAYFEKAGIERPNLKQIRDAIIEIRKKKLPDPKDIASCGSFFKNPIVAREAAARIKAKHPGAPVFPAAGGKAKLAAGWLIEQAGFKGARFGRIGVYEHNALVLTNLGGASAAELESAISRIQGGVSALFGVSLEPEVVRLA